MEIISGTTPTIVYTFSTIDVSMIRSAVLTIRSENRVTILKNLEDASIEASSLYWKLTQEESLSLKVGKASIMLNWVLNDGTRGVSRTADLMVAANDINEVI